MDKIEIINLARKINTYETSILPFEDCCTIFTPKNPVTKPMLAKAQKMESRFDFSDLLDQCVENVTILDVYPKSEDQADEDLF